MEGGPRKEGKDNVQHISEIGADLYCFCVSLILP